ncbi:MAG TPA: hypothetical protein VEA99_12570 [Gemmatimonadaceae bacterium]|nr:hypothetical protein [Gemmatimonadaceae bacterium]
MNRLLLVALVPLLVVACRPKFDRGPLQPGDSALATERIQPILDPDSPSDPPPPPVDTLSQMQIGGVQADLSDIVVRVRYYLDEKGTRGWVDFPQDNQPPGVTVDSAARIIIHRQSIGGVGTLQIRGAAGTVDVDLTKVSGPGTVIAGRCKKDQRRAGACATIMFKELQWTPTGGQPQTERGSLEIGIPAGGRR